MSTFLDFTTVPSDLLAHYTSLGNPSFTRTPTAQAPEAQARSIPFGNCPALIVIDVCNANLTPGSPLYAPDRFHDALTHVSTLIALFRRHELPVIFTRVHYPRGDKDAGGNWKKYKGAIGLVCFEEGNELAEYPRPKNDASQEKDVSGDEEETSEELEGPRRKKRRTDTVSLVRPGEGETEIVKQYASAFFGTTLSSILVAKKIDTVVLCGFSTSGCVRATAVDAAQHGYNPYVVSEACGDRHAYPHEASLLDIQAKYGEVVDMKEMETLLHQTIPVPLSG